MHGRFSPTLQLDGEANAPAPMTENLQVSELPDPASKPEPAFAEEGIRIQDDPKLIESSQSGEGNLEESVRDVISQTLMLLARRVLSSFCKRYRLEPAIMSLDSKGLTRCRCTTEYFDKLLEDFRAKGVDVDAVKV